MSNAIVSIILVALMVIAGMSFSKTAINAFDEMCTSWQAAEETRLEAVRSGMSIVKATALAGTFNLFLKNTGQSPILNYEDWDIIAQYYDAEGNYYIKHLTYVKDISEGSDQWYCGTIYTDEKLSTTEVFQPGIIDPGEVISLQLDVFPVAGTGTLGWVIISTGNGFTTSVQLEC
jgi:hypothetical protein